MTPWQSFFLAWVAAQILPALVSDPQPANLVGVSLFLGSIVSAFLGLNALASWVGALLGVAEWDPGRPSGHSSSLTRSGF